jgi:hypothetical protein
MMGHTDKATINERKPLTPLMAKMLRYIDRYPGVTRSTMTQPEANASRGLLDRRLIDWLISDRSYVINDSGREALKQLIKSHRPEGQ